MRPLLLLVALLSAGQPAPPRLDDLLLEVRVYDQRLEVTAETRVVVYRAGERDAPVASSAPGQPLHALAVQPGLYDVQALRARADGPHQLRWAERLSVLRYPDEGGRHLEVVNFDQGYGAVQIRFDTGQPPWTGTLYAPDSLTRIDTEPAAGEGYVLFVVPAGPYDIELLGGGVPPRRRTISRLDVPRGRTRLIVP